MRGRLESLRVATEWHYLERPFERAKKARKPRHFPRGRLVHAGKEGESVQIVAAKAPGRISAIPLPQKRIMSVHVSRSAPATMFMDRLVSLAPRKSSNNCASKSFQLQIYFAYSCLQNLRLFLRWTE